MREGKKKIPEMPLLLIRQLYNCTTLKVDDGGQREIGVTDEDGQSSNSSD